VKMHVHVHMCSVPQLKLCLSWKSCSSVGVPQLEINVLLSDVASSVILVVYHCGHSTEYTG
jgi:hypothetical protein